MSIGGSRPPLGAGPGCEKKTKTVKNFQDQDRSSFEIFGSRPRPGIIGTKTETGNYSASKNIPLSPSLIILFFIFPKSYNYISSE